MNGIFANTGKGLSANEC